MLVASSAPGQAAWSIRGKSPRDCSRPLERDGFRDLVTRAAVAGRDLSGAIAIIRSDNPGFIHGSNPRTDTGREHRTR